MSQYKVLYEELPEKLSESIKVFESTRRELTLIVRAAKEFGFDSHRDASEGSLVDFIEIKLQAAKLIESTSNASIIELEEVVYSIVGFYPARDAADTIKKAIELLKILKRIRDDFGDGIGRAFEEIY